MVDIIAVLHVGSPAAVAEPVDLVSGGAHNTRRALSLSRTLLSLCRRRSRSLRRRFSPELVGSLKLGNVLVFVQLIFGPRWPMNQLNKKSNIA